MAINSVSDFFFFFFLDAQFNKVMQIGPFHPLSLLLALEMSIVNTRVRVVYQPFYADYKKQIQ